MSRVACLQTFAAELLLIQWSGQAYQEEALIGACQLQ